MSNIRYEMFNDYQTITWNLFWELMQKRIDEKEFVFVRDFAIRRLYPDLFDRLPQAFICSECGKAERVTDAYARYENHNSGFYNGEVWSYYSWFSMEKEGGHGLCLCSDDCQKALKTRINSLGIANDDWRGYPENIRYELIKQFSDKAVAYLDEVQYTEKEKV